jgi:hypothetical protein
LVGFELEFQIWNKIDFDSLLKLPAVESRCVASDSSGRWRGGIYQFRVLTDEQETKMILLRVKNKW